MKRSDGWSTLAATLVTIGLRIVLTQQAEDEEQDADDRVHPSIDGRSSRLLPRRATQPMRATRDQPQPRAGDIPE
ncbi:MAG: hypothetical protein ABL953_10035 [Ilumatobacteraceae bacterium]